MESLQVPMEVRVEQLGPRPQDGELSEGVAVVLRVERAAQGLAVRGKVLHERLPLEELSGPLHGPPLGVEANRRQQPDVSEEGVVDLGDLRRVGRGPETGLDRELFGVVGPPLHERRGEVDLPHEASSAGTEVEELEVVPGEDFVNRDVPEHRAVQRAEPLLLLGHGPLRIDRRDVVNPLGAGVERAGRVHARRGEGATPDRGLLDPHRDRGGDRHEVVAADELLRLGNEPGRGGDDLGGRGMVLAHAAEQLRHRDSFVRRDLGDPCLVSAEVSGAGGSHLRERGLDPLPHEEEPLEPGRPESELGYGAGELLLFQPGEELGEGGLGGGPGGSHLLSESRTGGERFRLRKVGGHPGAHRERELNERLR